MPPPSRSFARARPRDGWVAALLFVLVVGLGVVWAGGGAAAAPARGVGLPAAPIPGQAPSSSPSVSPTIPRAKVVTAIPTSARRVDTGENDRPLRLPGQPKGRTGPPVWLMSAATLGAVFGGAGIGWYIHQRPSTSSASGGRGRGSGPTGSGPAGRAGGSRPGGSGPAGPRSGNRKGGRRR